MSLKVGAPTREFEVHPSGPHVGVCVDIIDMGIRETRGFGPKRKIRLVFLTEHQVEVGGEMQPALVSETFNMTLGANSMLRSFLEGWRGKPFTDTDLEGDGFEMEDLLGAPAMLDITHAPSDRPGGKPFANIKAATRVHKKMADQIPDVSGSNYVRVVHRSPDDQKKFFMRNTPPVQNTVAKPEAPAARSAPPPARKAMDHKAIFTEAPPRTDAELEEFLDQNDDDLPF